MTNYDAWLERPYRERDEREARLEAAAERHGLDLETDLDEVVERMEEDEEAAAEARYERMLEDGAEGRDVW